MDAINAQHLFDEAMKLPSQTREDLALRLMVSIEPNEADTVEVKQNWLEEVQRRAAASDRGDSPSVPIEQVWPRLAGGPWKSAPADDA